MKKMKIAALTSMLLASQWAAADLSYTNFGVGYIDGDIFNADLDGFEVRGNFALNSSFHLLGSYSALDQEPSGLDLDVLSFGAGWHTELNPNLDFVATGAVLDVDNGFISDNGIRLTGGVRGLAGEQFEFSGDIVFEDIDDFDDDIGIEVSGRFFIDRDLSIGLTKRDVNHIDTIRLDIRFDY